MIRNSKSAISRDPDVQGGTPVFAGTRVPVDVLLDYVEDGQPLDVFLAEYPGVTRELVVAALEEVKALLAETGEATVVRPD